MSHRTAITNRLPTIKPAHTPGPWRVEGHAVETLVDPDNSPSYIAPVCVMDIEWSAWRANARLIAAAPDMLEACQEALACILKHVPATAFAPREMLIAAILKAKG